MRFLNLLLVFALLSTLVSEAKAVAVIAPLTPGHMTYSPFLFQIKASENAGFIQYHVRVTSTSSARVFDKHPDLTLSYYYRMKGYVRILFPRPVQRLPMTRHRDSLECSFKVSVKSVQNGRLCFEYQHDPGLDKVPYLPSSMPGMIFFVARLKDFAPHAVVSTRTAHLQRLAG